MQKKENRVKKKENRWQNAEAKKLPKNKKR